jgi:sugar lactone lactonase YvrE
VPLIRKNSPNQQSEDKMSLRQVRLLLVFGILLALIAAASLAGAGATSPQATTYVPVATGLNEPRHLDFGPDGALYVAEAGAGGDLCVDIDEETTRCIGATGAITRVEDGAQERIADDLVSNTDDTGGDGTGPHDVAWDSEGNLMVIVGLGTDPAARDPEGPFGPLVENMGQLVQVAEDGTWTNVVDVSAHETAENPDGGELDSNPYALERVDDGYLVADAGANALLHVSDEGDISTVAVFPDVLVEFPPGSGDMIPMQAVPTSIDVGPDGAYYVGQLTGFPFPVGGANVWRVVEGEDPEVFADGFTNIVDIAFDADGNLYVVEIAHNSLLSGDLTGAVIRVDEDGNKTLVASEGLTMPGGIAIGEDGYLYVTTVAGLGGGGGEVLRLNALPTVYLPVIVP